MIRASIGNPYAVFVGVVILLIFSWIAFRSIPIQLKPTIDPPEIRVQTSYPGAGVLEVEDQITNRLERELASLNNLDQITSESEEGRSRITLLFSESADRGRTLLDTVQAVQRVADLPDLADEPQINVVSAAEQEVIMYISALGAASLEQKYDLLDEVVVPAVLRVPGVGGAEFFGGAERQIIVQPDIEAMAARGVTLTELSSALSIENQNLPGGQLEEGERQFNLRAMGRFRSLADIENTVISHGPSGTIRVGDIASARDDRARATRYVRTNGERSVVMRINRQSGANTLHTIDGVQEQLDEFTAQFQNQGIDIRLVTTNSEKPYIEGALHLVQHDLLLGAFLASLVLALFLRAGRPILIVVVSIPISLMSVFLVLMLLDRTVNIIVMAGLSFAAGMVVDDAIVALENIDRHMKELGKSELQAAHDGIEEVWGAIVSATLTKIAVFLPLLLNTTEAGLLFKDIAIAVMVSIFMSLVVTITVVPALSSLILKQHSDSARFIKRYPVLYGFLNLISLKWLGGWVENLYTRYLAWAVLHGESRPVGQDSEPVRNEQSRTSAGPPGTPAPPAGNVIGRLVLIGAIFSVFLLSLQLLPSASYLPNGTRPFIFTRAEPIIGQRNEVTTALFLPIEEQLSEDPRIERYFSVAAAPFFSAIGVGVKEEFADDATLDEISRTVSKLGSAMPGFRSFFARRSSIFRIRDKEFTLEITGPDLTRLKQIATQLQDQLSAREDIVAEGNSVRMEFAEGVPELAIRLDRHRAAEMGLSIVDVAHSLESIVAGRRVSTYTDAGREYDLLIQGNRELVTNRSALESILLDSRVTPEGVRPVRLGEIADVIEQTGPSSVRHFNRQRSIELTVNTRPDLPTQEALRLAREEIVLPFNAELPQGYSIFFGQAADKLRDTFTSLIFQGLLAIVIIYLLMVPLFRSFYYPLIILLTVPLAWSGSFLAIALAYRVTNAVVQFDVLAMLGLIIMSGIVVSNAILIIHQMLNFQRQGMSPNEALYQSARTRLRPIMMTVLTAVLGMAPLAFGSGPGAELYRSLGIIVEGGLISSTLFTLLLVPALMSLINDLNARIAARRAAG